MHVHTQFGKFVGIKQIWNGKIGVLPSCTAVNSSKFFGLPLKRSFLCASKCMQAHMHVHMWLCTFVHVNACLCV